ncbi:MAG: (Fe-S)-binding protein [Bacteroidales bacterium]|nr:(Fe-S)-binding protein [Bacteroidales bacterium]
MKFDWFVVPFAVGLVGLILFLTLKYVRWILSLPKEERKKIRKSFFSTKIFAFVWEVFREALLHVRIFKKNIILGYMHSSFAFGWFLLIVFGAIEVEFANSRHANHLYEPIFFRFFHRDPSVLEHHAFFTFIMDAILLYILSGLLLALTKRLYSRLMGMKKTTRLYWTDKIALYSLWLIFPLRLLAESSTAGIYANGGFMTNHVGSFLANLLPLEKIMYPLWWMYSIDLFLFFAFLPFSRYMHIPTEIVLIALRQAGIYTKNKITGFSQLEINACSSCGICIDACQIQDVLGRQNMIPAYLFQKIRHEKVLKPALYDCLICGRCEEACPVNINILNIKVAKRNEKLNHKHQQYDYLRQVTTELPKTQIAYFAGCMSHLTPSIKKAMVSIFEKTHTPFTFIDEDGSICCGRPLQLSGKIEDAKILMQKNKEIIAASGAEILVTSCPICYKVFNEEYQLAIKVMHHSQLFDLWSKQGKLKLNAQPIKASYHDPCDLGRGSHVYDAPRHILNQVITLQETAYQKEHSLCCGGSLGNFYFQEKDKVQVAQDAYDKIMTNHSEMLITSCPLCKKTFQKVAEKPVIDLAEIIDKALMQ